MCSKTAKGCLPEVAQDTPCVPPLCKDAKQVGPLPACMPAFVPALIPLPTRPHTTTSVGLRAHLDDLPPAPRCHRLDFRRLCRLGGEW